MPRQSKLDIRKIALKKKTLQKIGGLAEKMINFNKHTLVLEGSDSAFRKKSLKQGLPV